VKKTLALSFLADNRASPSVYCERFYGLQSILIQFLLTLLSGKVCLSPPHS
jgi:hypothetical protein